MTRFAKFLMALMLGLSLTQLAACDDDPNSTTDLPVNQDAGLDLSKKD